MLLLALIGVLAGYLYYDRAYVPRSASVTAKADSLTAIQQDIDSAKAELARGSVEDLRRRLDDYRASLDLMRRLVPARNEVPNLLDDMASRAKLRGVHIADWQPQTVEVGSPFDTYRYRFQVVGRYDEVGEFLSDVASLDRIIVPFGVSVQRAPQSTERAFQDTSGTLLRAAFNVRTFVKSTSDAQGGGGALP
jgi:Tfp pilus assembly protein PilO